MSEATARPRSDHVPSPHFRHSRPMMAPAQGNIVCVPFYDETGLVLGVHSYVGGKLAGTQLMGIRHA